MKEDVIVKEQEIDIENINKLLQLIFKPAIEIIELKFGKEPSKVQKEEALKLQKYHLLVIAAQKDNQIPTYSLGFCRGGKYHTEEIKFSDSILRYIRDELIFKDKKVTNNHFLLQQIEKKINKFDGTIKSVSKFRMQIKHYYEEKIKEAGSDESKIKALKFECSLYILAFNCHHDLYDNVKDDWDVLCKYFEFVDYVKIFDELSKKIEKLIITKKLPYWISEQYNNFLSFVFLLKMLLMVTKKHQKPLCADIDRFKRLNSRWKHNLNQLSYYLKNKITDIGLTSDIKKLYFYILRGYAFDSLIVNAFKSKNKNIISNVINYTTEIGYLLTADLIKELLDIDPEFGSFIVESMDVWSRHWIKNQQSLLRLIILAAEYNLPDLVIKIVNLGKKDFKCACIKLLVETNCSLELLNVVIKGVGSLSLNEFHDTFMVSLNYPKAVMKLWVALSNKDSTLNNVIRQWARQSEYNYGYQINGESVSKELVYILQLLQMRLCKLALKDEKLKEKIFNKESQEYKFLNAKLVNWSAAYAIDFEKIKNILNERENQQQYQQKGQDIIQYFFKFSHNIFKFFEKKKGIKVKKGKFISREIEVGNQLYKACCGEHWYKHYFSKSNKAPKNTLDLTKIKIVNQDMVKFLVELIENFQTCSEIYLNFMDKRENKVKINDSKAQFLAQVLAGVTTLQPLEEIKLMKCKISDKGIQCLLKSISKLTVRKIDLSYNKLSNKGFSTIINMLNLIRFKVLDISHCKMSDENIQCLSKVIEMNKSIKEVNLSGISFNIKTLNCLMDCLSKNNSLSKIDLISCSLPDIRPIAKFLEKNNTITYINLYNNKIQDEGIKILCNCLLNHKTIISINLGCNFIEDVGASHILHLLKLNPMICNVILKYNLIGTYSFKLVNQCLIKNEKLRTVRKNCLIALAGAAKYGTFKKLPKNIRNKIVRQIYPEFGK